MRRVACAGFITHLSAGLSTGDVDRRARHAYKRIAQRKTSLTNARIWSFQRRLQRLDEDAEKPAHVKYFCWSIFRQNPCGPCWARLCGGYTQDCPQACPQAMWIVASVPMYCVAACVWGGLRIDESDRIRSAFAADARAMPHAPTLVQVKRFRWSFFRHTSCAPCCAWLSAGSSRYCPQACPQALWIARAGWRKFRRTARGPCCACTAAAYQQACPSASPQVVWKPCSRLALPTYARLCEAARSPPYRNRPHRMSADPRPLAIALMGPTASGKTALALEWAQRYDGEICRRWRSAPTPSSRAR